MKVRSRVDGYAPIEDYAVLGDGRSVALIASDGSVDWWPIPTLDSPPICAAILNPKWGGRFCLAPTSEFEVERHYVSRTNVVEATYTTANGAVRVIESLNTGPAGRLPWTELARRVEGLHGQVEMRWEFLAGDRFGQAKPKVSSRQNIPVVTVQDQTLAILVFGADPGLSAANSVTGRFLVRASDRVLIAAVVTDDEPLFLPSCETIEERIDRTIESWRSWSGRIDYQGPWSDAVLRSALALKLLLYESGGAIAAAATTSLPEAVGGPKNWDYRFSWVRDSSFTLDAFINLGLHEEVHASVSWLLAALRRTSPDLHVFYTLGGNVPGKEAKLDVPGYRNSRPVRAGNSAATQVQLGNYGDLFDTILRYTDAGHLLDQATGSMLADLADRCCDTWMVRDSGIWELQQLEHYTISKIGCWVALDRATRLAEAGQIPNSHFERWRAEAAGIKAWVLEHCWSKVRQTYTFFAGSEDLDAAVLLAGRTGFDEGPNLIRLIEAVSSELGVKGSPLLYRYTGMEREEGAFVACTFWMVDALVRTWQIDRARRLMDEAVELVSDLGLLSEQMDPRDSSFLGNLPQGLSHLALINAAFAYKSQVDRHIP